MSDRKEYRAWEIFWHGGVVYQCVPDSNGDGYCNNCEMEMWCDYKPYACCSFERSDNTWVHYVKVTEPKEGMLFRASDGVLYELKKLVGGCGCCLYGYIGCDDIDYEAFGKNVLGGFHWYPVEEKKEEEVKMENQKRHLELTVVKIEGDQVTFRIADGEGYEKPWPQEGDIFYYITITGDVVDSKYETDGCSDGVLLDFGNFFRTREEAEAALERVKKALKG